MFVFRILLGLVAPMGRWCSNGWRKCLLATVATTLLFLFLFVSFVHYPLNASQGVIIYDFAPGTSAYIAINDLKAKSLLNPIQALLLKAYLRIKKQGTALQAGEYEIPYHITPKQLLSKWVSGDVLLYAVRIAEGDTVQKALTTINDHPATVITKGEGFCDGCEHPEGLLFPETYYFGKNTESISLLKIAYLKMQAALTKAWQNRSQAVVLKTPYEALVLASIIEKEAALPAERPLISAVFQKRLQKNMRLQADPTVVYGLGAAYSDRLTYADLKKDTPYNTYLHKGLPPTPIAIPSLEAIIAACQPAPCKYLYFVSKNDGSHYFSETLTEHNQAVQKYQKSTDNL